jgi:hypothetical protein
MSPLHLTTTKKRTALRTAMSIVLEAQEIGTLKRRNKILTLLVMSCFALSLAFLGYGFDYVWDRCYTILSMD